MIDRRVAVVVALVVQIGVASGAEGGHVIEMSTGVVLGSGSTVAAWGNASAHDENGDAVGISGALALYEGGVGPYYTIGSMQFFEPEGSWNESNLTATGQPGLCYASGLTVQTSLISRTGYGDGPCVPPPPVYKPPPVLTVECPTSPIVVNIADASYLFADHGPLFDLTADGTREHVSWPADPAKVGFLFLDLNGNGVPDDGSELFGDRRRLQDGRLALHGFEALAEFDSNGDAAITPADARWRDLRLWFDADRNGTATDAEISRLADVAFVSLSLDPAWSGRRDQFGNILRWRAMAAFSTAAGVKRTPYYDVYLTFSPAAQ